jgi:hypothetical protein
MGAFSHQGSATILAVCRLSTAAKLPSARLRGCSRRARHGSVPALTPQTFPTPIGSMTGPPSLASRQRIAPRPVVRKYNEYRQFTSPCDGRRVGGTRTAQGHVAGSPGRSCSRFVGCGACRHFLIRVLRTPFQALGTFGPFATEIGLPFGAASLASHSRLASLGFAFSFFGPSVAC